jgi:RNA polymerase sigma-70 factor (ECF subfamily)
MELTPSVQQGRERAAGVSTPGPPGGASAGRGGYAEFYFTSYGRLAAQLSAYLGDPAEAEDVVQEAFLRAWQRWKKVSAYDEPVAWVRRVAWNLATNRWRRLVADARLRLRHGEPDAVAALGPDNVALVAALRQLPARQRQVIVLHYLADLPVAEIAAELSVPRGTVLSWLHRGRARLAALLRDTDPPPPPSTPPTPSTTTTSEAEES